jgi:hypothetical protein
LAAASKPQDIDVSLSQVPSAHPVSSLSVLPTENRRYASAKPQLVSIRAGQGPSDPQTSDALKKSAKTTRESRPDIQEKPSTSTQASNSRVQEHVKRYEALRAEVPASTSTRAHANSVEQNGRSAPTSKPQSTSAATANNDRSQAYETSARAELIPSISSRTRARNLEPNDRSGSSFQQPPHQSMSASQDRSQSNEVWSDLAAPTPRVQTNSVEPPGRSEATPKPSTCASNVISQSDETTVRPDMALPIPFRARTTNVEANHRSASKAKSSLSQPTDAVPPNRFPKSRTVRFNLPDPTPSPPPVTAPIAAVETTSSVAYTSRSVTEIRSPPMFVPTVPSSSSSSRQTSTPSQSNQIVLSSPQIKDGSALHLPRSIDQQSLAPPMVQSLSQPQRIPDDATTKPPMAPQASPARNTLSQMENKLADQSERAAERTVIAQVLPTTVTSQSQWMSTPVQTTPSQSTSRSTTTNDAPPAKQHDTHAMTAEQSLKQDAGFRHHQTPVPVPQISLTADQLRTISQTPHTLNTAVGMQSSSTGAKISMAVPAIAVSQISPSQNLVVNASVIASTGDDFSTQSQATVGDVVELPALPQKPTDSYIPSTPQQEPVTGRQAQSSAPADARPPPEPSQRFAFVSARGRDTTANSQDIQISPASVVQVQQQGNAMSALSGARHSRQNSIDVSSTRPEVLVHAPAPQILVEESPYQISRRDAFPPADANAPLFKSLPSDLKPSTATNGPDMYFSSATVVQAHAKSSVMPALSGGRHSRQNSIDVGTSRPEVLAHAPIPQILVEESPHLVPQRDAFAPVVANTSESKSLPPDPKPSTTVSAPAPLNASGLQIAISRDTLDNQMMSDLRSPRVLIAPPLTSSSFSKSATSTSASSNQPTIGTDSSRSRRALLNEVRSGSFVIVCHPTLMHLIGSAVSQYRVT